MQIQNSFIDNSNNLYLTVEICGIGYKDSVWCKKTNLETFTTGGSVPDGDTWETKGIHYIIPLNELKIGEIENWQYK